MQIEDAYKPKPNKQILQDAIDALATGKNQEAIAGAMICQAQYLYYIGRHLETMSKDLNGVLCELTRITESLEGASFGGDVVLDVTRR
jgi:hypothetical protein